MIGQKVRKEAFWIYDSLQGNKVKNHFDDICDIIENHDADSDNRIECYLSKLLSHALETTDFYFSQKAGPSIKEFPVINKNIIRENFDDFISSSFKKRELESVVTSGSTGTPFKVLLDPNKVRRNTADTLYFAQLAGYELGQHLYYFKIWNDENDKGGISSFLQNVTPVDVHDQSDTFFEKLVNDLKEDKTIKSFLGYASFFEALCQYLDKTAIAKASSRVQSIISMSEALNAHTKLRMEKYFDCEIVSRYSNTENGILAQQKRGGDDKFYLNKASYFFEILAIDNNDEVPEGEPGRIIVTDLFNYGMPMIRYDTGDIGIWEYNKEGEKVLANVEGRRMDMIYNTDGKLVSSYVITNNMWKYTHVKQYQFIQESSDTYCFKINPTEGFVKEKELIKEFSNYFGSEASIRVEYVNEIPLLSSGKRKKVVNKMN